MHSRRLIAQHPAARDDIADLVTRRPLPGARIEQIDPFLFLNHHGPQTYAPGNHGLPFGPHPHRGFETVTFIIEGELAHRDSGGHESVIRAGGVQWMTAGSGLVHSELSPESFKQSGGPLEILQLWVNLPARLKMTQPRYVGLQRNEIPQFDTGAAHGVAGALIAGEFEGHRGAIAPHLDFTLMTLAWRQADSLWLPAPASHNIFLYVMEGELNVGPDDAAQTLPAHHLAQFGHDGAGIALRAAPGARILFGHALPLGEPVVSHGPFVMNTREEIQQAIRDYQAGLFE
jgi:redox-sensitive bicupin YhaK (pirin superfamily)